MVASGSDSRDVASGSDSRDVVRVLLEAKADPNIADDKVKLHYVPTASVCYNSIRNLMHYVTVWWDCTPSGCLLGSCRSSQDVSEVWSSSEHQK